MGRRGNNMIPKSIKLPKDVIEFYGTRMKERPGYLTFSDVIREMLEGGMRIWEQSHPAPPPEPVKKKGRKK